MPDVAISEPFLGGAQANALKALGKIKKTWTKLTDKELALYKQGKRGAFLNVLQRNYLFTPEEAENILSTIEHLAEKD